MTKLGVLLIGGKRSHQENHAVVFSEQPRCQLVAVADEPDAPKLRHELNQELADDHGIPYIRDLDEALARPDVQIVSMCARIERRGVVAVKCAEAGKHVYLDKPLCGSVEAADAIVEAMDASGVVNQMYSMVHSGWVQRAKHAIESGALGTLRAIHCEEMFAKGPAGTAPKNVVRKEKERHTDFTFPESKREMFDIGVYPLTVIHWLTGRKAESVTALTGNYFFAEHVENDTEDFGAISMQLEGGISASIIAGRFGYMSHPGGGVQRIVLVGDRATATFDANRPRIEIYNTDPSFVQPERDPFDPMRMWGSTDERVTMMPRNRWRRLAGGRDVMVDDIAAFVDCIENEDRPLITAREAAQPIEILMAAFISAAQNEEIRLPIPRTPSQETEPHD